MNRKKYILLLTLVLAMSVLLSACGLKLPFGNKGPTAQELVDGVGDIDTGRYYDVSIKADIKGEQDGSEVSVTLDASFESDNNIVHVYDATVGIGASGFSIELQMEAWADNANRVSYTNAYFMGQNSGWTRQDIADGKSSVGSLSELMEGVSRICREGSEPQLLDHVSGEDYMVIWEAPMHDVSSVVGDLGDMSGSNVAMGDITNASVKAVFAEDSHALKTITISGHDANDCGVEIEVAFNIINGDKSLRIPQSVTSTGDAENLGQGDGTFGWVVGDEDSGDVTSAPPTIGNLVPEVSEQPTVNPNGGSAAAVDTDTYRNDGEGYDPEVDGMIVPRLRETDQTSYVGVYHYGEVNSLYWNFETNGFYGSMTLDHVVKENNWYDPQREFDYEYDYRREELGDSALIAGSREQGAAVYTKSEYGTTYIYYMAMIGDYYVEIQVTDYNGRGYDDALSVAGQALTLVGLT